MGEMVFDAMRDCDGITNMRDLGGYTVADGTIRQGLIYRCARLNNTSYT